MHEFLSNNWIWLLIVGILLIAFVIIILVLVEKNRGKTKYEAANKMHENVKAINLDTYLTRVREIGKGNAAYYSLSNQFDKENSLIRLNHEEKYNELIERINVLLREKKTSEANQLFKEIDNNEKETKEALELLKAKVYSSIQDDDLLKEKERDLLNRILEINNIFYKNPNSLDFMKKDQYNLSVEFDSLFETFNQYLARGNYNDAKETLAKMFSNEVEGNMSLDENHKLVNESLIKFTNLLNTASFFNRD